MEVAVWLSPVLALVGGAMGAWLSPFFSDRIAQLRTWRNRFDEAISSVYVLQSARRGVSISVPGEYIHAGGDEKQKFDQELSKDAVKRFVEEAAACRSALATVLPKCSEIADFVDAFEISETDADRVAELLDDARRRLGVFSVR